MKRCLIALLSLLCMNGFSQVNSDLFFGKCHAFLKANVVDGEVDYQSIKTDKQNLEELLYLLDKTKIPEQDSVAKALMLNAYNLFVIQKVLRHYPISTPQEIGGFFSDRDFKLAGEKYSLNSLEEQIFERFPDPRLHFVLVCAAK
ncbi:MAG: DUF547 domain-containing protein, partial [Luteibaculum sp.]